MYQPKTGVACSCKPGRQRDNCPQCEGTGQCIDFAAIRKANKPAKEVCPDCQGKCDTILEGLKNALGLAV